MSRDRNFSNWLKERRGELGVTQEQVSEQLGFSLATMRKLEAGERRPSGQIAYLLAAYFRVPDDEREAFIAFARTGHSVLSAGEAEASNASSIPPWRGAYAHKTNLPAVLTPLIGREQEEEAVRDLFLNSRTRLVTLIGSAGIGKTRLALQVASGLFEHFEDGIYFVDLAPILDPDAVLQAAAHTLGLKEEIGRSVESGERALLEYVRERRMLIVLDNFEQVLDAAASLVKLMQASPWLKVLVTSREALHVRGERRVPVPPLSVPDPDDLPALDTLAHYPSVELFIERAQAVALDFELTQSNAADISAVCAGLEGLPLAIELAASRANHLSTAEMRNALGNRLKLLTGGARDLPERHRTLRGAIEWSYKLLDEHEQRLFRHLGAFVGGFTSGAIDATYESQPGSLVSASDMLASLTDKSLVQRDSESAGRAKGRFRLLEAVREYATEQLDKHAEADGAKSRHAEYYLSMADRAEKHFTGPQYPQWGAEQIEWIDLLEADLDNMRGALDWYEAQAESEVKRQAGHGAEARAGAFDNLEKGLKLASDLRRIWFGRGYFAEGLQRLRIFVTIVPVPLPAEPLELRAAYAGALLILGRLASSQEDIASAIPLLEEARDIFIELNDRQMSANVFLVIGSLAVAKSDIPLARVYLEQCLASYRALDNKWGMGAALDALGTVEVATGNFVLARPLLLESLACYEAVGEQFGAASALRRLGLIAYYHEEYPLADAFWERALLFYKEAGERNGVGDVLVLQGMLAVRLGDFDKARALLKEGLALARQLRSEYTIHRALVGFGMLERHQRNARKAAIHFGAADALARAESIQLSVPYQAEMNAEVDATRAHLDESAWDKAWALGTSMSVDEAITALLTPEGTRAQRARASSVSAR